MRRRLFLTAAIVLCVSQALLPSAYAQKGVVLKFENLRPDSGSLPAYIAFGGAGTLSGTNLSDNSALQKGVAYELGKLSAGVSITQFDGGRIYVSLGTQLRSPSEANGFRANFADPSKEDFTTRWDQVMLNFQTGSTGPGQGLAKLTATEFFGIPLQLKSSWAAYYPANLSWRTGSDKVLSVLARMSGRSVLTPQNPSGTVVTGLNGVTVDGVNGSVVRVLGPSGAQFSGAAGDVNAWPAPDVYLGYLRSGSTKRRGYPVYSTLAGNNGVLPGGERQTYTLKVWISNKNDALVGAAIYPGDLVIDGTMNNGGPDLPLSIYVRAADVTPAAFYGAEPKFTIVQGSDVNGVAKRAVTDYLAAMNLGLVGSLVDNPAQPGTAIGDSPSWTWFGNRPDGTNVPPLSISNAFSYAQPNNPGHYDQYSSYLAGVGDAYSFPYCDRVQFPSAALGDGSDLTLSILPDTDLAEVDPPSDLTIVDAASFVRGVYLAPGSVAILSGDLAVSAATYAPGMGTPLPTAIRGLSLRFANGQYAPIFTGTPSFAVFQVPWELSGYLRDTVVVRGYNEESTEFTVRLSDYSPSIFATGDAEYGQGHIYTTDGQLVDPSHPAHTGSDIIIHCTGLGPVREQPPTGVPASDQLVHNTLTTPIVTIGGVNATLTYAGLSPGMVGLYEIRARVPAGGKRGDAVPVNIRIGGAISNIVTMAVCDSGCVGR
jgi:uncharacterized protein (TIGR03437 family)